MPDYQMFEFFTRGRIVGFEKNAVQKRCPLDCLAADDPLNFEQSTSVRKGKFIQVELNLDALQGAAGGQKQAPRLSEVLLFMPFGPKIWYHAVILKECLMRLRIAGGFPEKYRQADNYEYCHFDERLIKVFGGGYYEADPDCLLLTLSGKSTAYGAYRKGGISSNYQQNEQHFAEYQMLVC